MTKLDIALPPHTPAADLASCIEQACARQGLSVSMRCTLRAYPGCTHWHLKQGAERGTLEVTLWPRERRLWLSIQSGRAGTWTEAAAERLRAALHHSLWGEPPADSGPVSG